VSLAEKSHFVAPVRVWILALLFLASCSSGEAQVEQSQSDRSTRPIHALLDIAADVEEVDFRALDRAVELSIQACMADAGFEYTPELDIEYGDSAPVPATESAAVEGYGYVRDFEANLGPITAAGTSPSENESRLAKMSAQEREAFEKTLWGDEASTLGCFDSATAQAYSIDPNLKADAFYQNFGSELADLYDQVEADQRLIDAGDARVRCLNQAGYGVDEIQEASDLVFERLDQLEPMIEMVLPDPQEPPILQLPDDGLALLEEVRMFEIELAVTDINCSAAVDTVYDDLIAEYEQRFLDENQGAILALLEAVG